MVLFVWSFVPGATPSFAQGPLLALHTGSLLEVNRAVSGIESKSPPGKASAFPVRPSLSGSRLSTLAKSTSQGSGPHTTHKALAEAMK